MAKNIYDWVIDKILGDSFVGKYGEFLTEKELRIVSLFGRKGKVLRNVYLPKTNDETSEVDVIYITQKGIFVFESKNYSGWIYGNDSDKNWTVSLPNGKKIKFYNPVLQNKSHIKWMRNFVGEDIPLFSIVVFSERCELKYIEVHTDEVHVIKRDETYTTVRDIWERYPDAVSDEKISELYEKLKELTKVDKATKQAHIEKIENKYKKPGNATKPKTVPKSETFSATETAPKPETEQKSETVSKTETTSKPEYAEERICPKCGSKLVLRTAKKGANSGNQFWGCSEYPRCKYIKDN